MWSRLGFALALATTLANGHPHEQQPLISHTEVIFKAGEKVTAPRPLYGRFLHITDIHPDPFYKTYSSTSEDDACHHGHGGAGVYGAEVTDCDAPFSLVNETFRWIEENLKDSIDFVIWTGDSARHDNDEKHPRTDKQVLELNKEMVDKFVDVFGKDDNINDTDPTNDFVVPIVPTFGNNDILPHNIFTPGPNKWTRTYLDVWNKFIPEAQRHTFAYGGWFFTEVIPGQLAVFSLNTIYFFDSNAAVDGCADKSEPGYQQMEWLRIQLQFLRKRGMKAIMMGHVPPARTASKQSWDETCWQKYTLWMKQYRDVVVGGTYGHMNIDHFMFQDERDLEFETTDSEMESDSREAFGDRLSIQSSGDYLTELRKRWSKIPSPPSGLSYLPMDEDRISQEDADDLEPEKKKKSKKQKKREKFLKKIGGEYAERYSVTLVSPSVIPNYFPSLRVIEYNVTGVENALYSQSPQKLSLEPNTKEKEELEVLLQSWKAGSESNELQDSKQRKAPEESKKKKKKKKKKKPKTPKFPVPKPPSSTAPPGPAYSPQPFTWTAVVQYYANLTYINNDFTKKSHESNLNEIDPLSWHDGPHHGKKTPEKPDPRKLVYEVEYDTRNDTVIGNMSDLTVRSYLHLAERIGRYKPSKGDRMDYFADGSRVNLGEPEEEISIEVDEQSDHKHEDANENMSIAKKKKGKKHKKKKKRKAINNAWFTFVKRAYVGAIDEEQLHQDFGQVVDPS